MCIQIQSGKANRVSFLSDYGTLRDSATSAAIRAATYEERNASDASDARGQHGHIEVDGRRCYVD
jgi:hypothetical protein